MLPLVKAYQSLHIHLSFYLPIYLPTYLPMFTLTHAGLSINLFLLLFSLTNVSLIHRLCFQPLRYLSVKIHLYVDLHQWISPQHTTLFNLTIHSLHDFIFKSMRLYLHISSKCSLLLLFYSPLGLFIHCLSSFFYSSFSNARLHRFQLFFISLSLSFHVSYPHKFSAD